MEQKQNRNIVPIFACRKENDSSDLRPPQVENVEKNTAKASSLLRARVGAPRQRALRCLVGRGT